MKEKKTLSGRSWEEVWHQINADFSSASLNDYHVHIQEEGRDMKLDITSSPGGSDEGGYDTTTITSALTNHSDFRFAIHPEDFLYKMGKLFGIEDVTLGYPEFDKNVIVKTNNEAKLKSIFADSELRKVFEELSGYDFRIAHDEDKQLTNLQLHIQRAITNSATLIKILKAFHHVLVSLEERK